MELRPIWVIAIVLTAATSLLLVPACAQPVETPGDQLGEGSRRELLHKEHAKVAAPKGKGPGETPQPKKLVQPKLGSTHAAANATRPAAAKPLKPAAAAKPKPPAANATRPATAKPQKLTAAAATPRKPAAAGLKPPAAKVSPTKPKPASSKPVRKAGPGPPAAKASKTTAKPASRKSASPQPRARPKPVPKAAALPAAKAAGKSGQKPAAGRKTAVPKGSKIRRRPVRPAARAKAAASSKYGSEITEILDLHNYSRARHGVSPLGWDPAAAVWAENWAKECNWGSNHSDPYISNIAMTYPGWMSVYKTWYDDEVGIYDWAAATYADVWGHFTAIVWKSTTAVGCGKAWCVNMPIGPQSWTGYYYVCNYSPPGNMIGAFRDNVLPVLWNAKPKQQ